MHQKHIQGVSNGLSEFENLSREDAQKILAVFLLTDGSVIWNKTKKSFFVVFNNVDDSLHELFKSFLMKAFDERPTFNKILQHRNRDNRTRVTGVSRKPDSIIVKKLFSFSPTFKTKPCNIPIEEFLRTNKPTISFLSDAPKEIKIIAFRIAMSCDGSIGISFTSDGELRPKLRLGCAHPVLLEEWKRLASEVGLKMNIEKDKNTWSGLHSIETNSINEIRNFQKIGGFLPADTLVGRGKFKNWEKNTVLDLSCRIRSIV